MIVFLQVRIRRGEVASPSGLGNPTPTDYLIALYLTAPCGLTNPQVLGLRLGFANPSRAVIPHERVTIRKSLLPFWLLFLTKPHPLTYCSREALTAPCGLTNPQVLGLWLGFVNPSRAVLGGSKSSGCSKQSVGLPNAPAYLLLPAERSFVGFRFRSTQPTILRTSNDLLTFTNNSDSSEASKVPLNPSDKRGKTREKIPSYLLPLSGELGGWLCIRAVTVLVFIRQKIAVECPSV